MLCAPPPDPAAARRTGAADLRVAGLLAAAAAGVTAWQTLSLPPAVAQFPKYPLAALQQRGGALSPERLGDFSPLYLAAHSAAAALADPARAVLLLQAGCVGLAAALLFLALRRHVGPLPAVAGAAALALERSVAVHAFIFEPEALLLLFLAAWLYFAGGSRPREFAAAGTALALALLTRPGLLALGLLTPLALLARRVPRRAPLAAAGAFLLPVVLALGLLAARGRSADGFWPPMVMNPGTVFFDGNSALSFGYGATYPRVVRDVAAASPTESDFEHAAYRRLARVDAGREIGIGAVNRFWAAKALDFIADEPAAALRRAAHKVFYAIHPYPWYDFEGSSQAHWALRRRGTPATPGALLAALATVGVALALPRWRELFAVYALGAAQLAVMVATYASARQRLALLPALCCFAAIALERLTRGGRGAIAGGAAVLLLAGVFWLETDAMRDHRRLHDPQPEATAAAIPAILPGTGDRVARFSEAVRLFNAERLDDAEPLFVQLRSEGYASPSGEPTYYLGRIAALRGRPEAAAALMREALARTPGHPVVLAQLAALTGEPVHAARLYRYLDASDARFELARAYLMNGRVDEALPLLRRVTADLPEDGPAAELLAQALAAAGAGELRP